MEVNLEGTYHTRLESIFLPDRFPQTYTTPGKIIITNFHHKNYQTKCLQNLLFFFYFLRNFFHSIC